MPPPQGPRPLVMLSLALDTAPPTGPHPKPTGLSATHQQEHEGLFPLKAACFTSGSKPAPRGHRQGCQAAPVADLREPPGSAVAVCRRRLGQALAASVVLRARDHLAFQTPAGSRTVSAWCGRALPGASFSLGAGRGAKQGRPARPSKAHLARTVSQRLPLCLRAL